MSIAEQIAALEARLTRGGEWLDAQQAAGHYGEPEFERQFARWCALLEDLGRLCERQRQVAR